MHDGGGGNDLVRRIALEVETGRCAYNGVVDRPHAHSVQCVDHIMVVEVDIQSAELNEFDQFPQYYGGNGPPAPRQQDLLGRPEFTTDREDKNVRVKIEHLHPSGGQS